MISVASRDFLVILQLQKLNFMKKYDELKVFCKNTNEYINIDGGEALIDVYDTIKSRGVSRGTLCAY